MMIHTFPRPESFVVKPFFSFRFSGGHLNPAVTLGLTIMRGLPLILAPLYVLAQLLGGIIGAALAKVFIYFTDTVHTTDLTSRVCLRISFNSSWHNAVIKPQGNGERGHDVKHSHQIIVSLLCNWMEQCCSDQMMHSAIKNIFRSGVTLLLNIDPRTIWAVRQHNVV